jgi:hypothetical protein
MGEKGMIIPGAQYIIGALLITTLASTTMWQYERANSAGLVGELNGAKQSNIIMNTALAANEKAFDSALAVSTIDREESTKLESDNNQLTQLVVNNAADSLRSRYEKQLEVKKNRVKGGRDSANRINDSMCRAAGLSASCHDEQTPRTDGGDSPGYTPLQKSSSDSLDS